MWLKAKSGRGPKVLICKVIKIFPHSPAFPPKNLHLPMFTTQWRNTGGLKQKHKKTAFWRRQCIALVVSAVACLISSRCLNQPHHITNAALPSEVGGVAKRIKTARLRRKTNLQKSDYPKTRIKRGSNALCVLEYDNLYLCQITNNQCIMLIIGGREISRPYQNVGYRLEKFDAVFYQEIMLS